MLAYCRNRELTISGNLAVKLSRVRQYKEGLKEHANLMTGLRWILMHFLHTVWPGYYNQHHKLDESLCKEMYAIPEIFLTLSSERLEDEMTSLNCQNSNSSFKINDSVTFANNLSLGVTNYYKWKSKTNNQQSKWLMKINSKDNENDQEY